MRILFVSPRPFGLMATPGTYLSVEAYSKTNDVYIVASSRLNGSELIVHKSKNLIPTTLLDHQSGTFADDVCCIIKKFSPDILCIAQWPKWHILVEKVRGEFPDLLISLEIKSPSLMPENAEFNDLFFEWRNVHRLLDSIIAPSIGMAHTYFKEIEVPFLQHKSIVDYEMISKRVYDSDKLICRNFVFTGSLSEKRKLDCMIRFISKLPIDLLRVIHLDIYGDGSCRNELTCLVNSLGLDSVVSFFGTLPQDELYKKYKHYDAGFAWVPKDLYDTAPSLKLIEYCASGILPVATNTKGHLLQGSYGFFINFFEEHSEQSFVDEIIKICTEGVDTRLLQSNMQYAKEFDYLSVISDEIMPWYQDLFCEKERERKFFYKFKALNGEAYQSIFGQHHFRLWKKWIMSSFYGDILINVVRKDIDGERILHCKRIKKLIEQ